MTADEKAAIDACKDQAAKEFQQIHPYYSSRKYNDFEEAMGHSDSHQLKKIIDRAMQLYGEQCKPKWIPVDEMVPDSNRMVLLLCTRNGKTYQCMGFYTKTNETEVGRTSDFSQDYDEEIGEYYLKPGFYEEEEIRTNEYDSLYVHRNATHWMEQLPEPLTAQA